MGKWTAITKTLPRLLNKDVERQKKIDDLKDLLTSPLPHFEEQRQALDVTRVPRQGGALATRYAELRHEKAELARKYYGVKLAIEALEQLIVDQYEAEGVTSLTTPLGAVRYEDAPRAVVKDADALREWAKKEGLERKLQLPWPTTNALMKARLEVGEAEMPGVEAFVKAKLVYTPADGKLNEPSISDSEEE